MEHVEKELERISERLAGPLPLEHAALYAAQQALMWATNPTAFASPYAWITNTREASGGCSEGIRLPLS
jgi:hypothetical protein